MSTGQPSSQVADKTTLRKMLGSPGPSREAFSPPLGLWERLIGDAARARGRGNVIALAGQSLADPVDLEPVLKAAVDGRVAIHLITLGDSSRQHPLEVVCRNTDGIFLAATAAEQIPGLYQQIYASLLNRYEIVYRLAPGVSSQAGARVQVQVYAERGYGEDSADLLGK